MTGGRQLQVLSTRESRLSVPLHAPVVCIVLGRGATVNSSSNGIPRRQGVATYRSVLATLTGPVRERSGLPGARLLYENLLVLGVADDPPAFPDFVCNDELKPAECRIDRDE